MQELEKSLLREKYPTKEAVTTEIINLEAILNLSKSTEAFMSDIPVAHSGRWQNADH
ncbi:fructose-bisphosphatase class III [Schleiferilactobacillus harbinensis]|uniref:Fructose-bisphosphatase class III n=1 Tax=Schleiferilactobacillus harbinensis TaxID=304207 RepID=A0ABU7SZ53_9LACO